MRHRKKVLLWSALPVDMDAAKFAIDTRGMHARCTDTVEAFCAQLAQFEPDGVALWYDGDVSLASLCACQEAAHEAGIPVMVISRRRALFESCIAPVVVAGPKPLMIDILEGMRTLCARKRGPRRANSQTTIRAVSSAAGAVALSARLA